LIQLNPTFELHQRVLGELDRRDGLVREKEGEARRLLEQALAQCAAERAAIAQERAVLAHAEQLYRRFLGASDVPDLAVETSSPPSEMEESEIMTEPLIATPLPDNFDSGSDIETRVRELRSDLCGQVTLENASAQKSAKWAGPLRALLSSHS